MATAICEEGGRNNPYAGYFGILQWHEITDDLDLFVNKHGILDELGSPDHAVHE